MVQADSVIAAVRQALPDAQVEVEDLTGGGDHLQLKVVSTAFAGLSRIKQHQLGQFTLPSIIGCSEQGARQYDVRG